MKKIFDFHNIWLVLPLFLMAIYLIPSIYGIFYFKTPSALLFIGILFVGSLSYFLSYYLFRRKSLAERLFISFTPNKFNHEILILIICIIYFAIFLTALFTSPKIAIVEALRGASGEDIAIAREMLFKMRAGPWRSLLYLNTLVSSALMPFAMCLAYVKKVKYRHILLFFFLLTLIPSLEKAAAIKALLPLILLGFNGYIPRSNTILFVLLLPCFIFGTASLTKAGHMSASTSLVMLEQKDLGGEDSSEVYNLLFSGKAPPMADVHRFEMIDTSNPVGLIMNRLLWIPYVTAYDWLVFFKTYLKNNLLLGRTSKTVSILTGRKHFNMDQAVFAMEFSNGKIVSTGSANAVYMVDAFVNFSWVGVVLFSAILALISRLLIVRQDPVLSSCFYFYICLLVTGSLIGTLLSNGLAIFILLILFVPNKGLGPKNA